MRHDGQCVQAGGGVRVGETFAHLAAAVGYKGTSYTLRTYCYIL